MERASIPTAYLDNSATTKPCPEAIQAMLQCMEEDFYNPSSVYRPAVAVFGKLRAARQDLLKPIHGTGHDLIFTSGGTEANNLAILGAVRKMRGVQKLAYTRVEHPSIRAAFEALAKEGHEVIALPVHSDGTLDFEALENALNDGVALISCMQVNNETGALLDVRRLTDLNAGRALIHVDGVQGYLRVPIDISAIDLYSFSGHKIHGPKGIGALAVKKGIRLEPRQIGGGQEGNIRSGTENVPGILGFHAAALRLTEDAGLAERLMALKLRLIEGIQASVPEAQINGPDPGKATPHIVNISFPGVRGETMLHALEDKRIYVSTGSACSSKKQKVSPVLTAMGLPQNRAEGALRFSLGALTTAEEIDYAVSHIGGIYRFLSKYQRR